MAGRYTAQHLGYPSYQEANSGATYPYTTAAYGCPHSQRAYLFQFDNLQQRQQFDAANTSCCNEPAAPFHHKPQYAESWKPPVVQDCESKRKVTGCNVLELTDGGKGPCASLAGTGNQTGILVKCPLACADLVEAQAGKPVLGTYGQFEYAGAAGADLYEFRYVPDSDLLTDAWNACSGISVVEMLCREVPVTITISAHPLKFGGCDCDCCGNLPVSADVSTAGCSGESGGWSNRVHCGQAWRLGNGCSGQGEALDIYWTSGDHYPAIPHTWETGPSLAAYGSWWSLSGTPGYIGDGDYPACCGLSGVVEYDRGCAAGGEASDIVWQEKMPTASNIYAQGGIIRDYYSGSGVSGFITMLRSGASVRYVSGYQACSWSNKAYLEISGWAGMNITYGITSREVAKLSKSLGILNFDTDRNSQCCGFGRFNLYFNNGCDDLDMEPIYVRQPATPGDEQIGRIFRCYEKTPGSFVIQEAPLYCSGWSEGWAGATESTPPRTPAPATYAECNECIGSGSSGWLYTDPWGHGCNTAADPNCCYVSQNGSGGADYRALLWQGMGTAKCCPDVPRVAGYYVRESGDCCPAKTGEAWN